MNELGSSTTNSLNLSILNRYLNYNVFYKMCMIDNNFILK